MINLMDRLKKDTETLFPQCLSALVPKAISQRFKKESNIENPMSPDHQPYHQISGREDGVRLESRLLEERIQAAVEKGERRIEVAAYGQHGIGGRLWKAGSEPLRIRVTGHSGQRLGSMGFPNTYIETTGPASDDVGWLN